MERSAYLSLLLADSRLPSGAHTQSAGVEPALLGGMTVSEVPAFLRARLRSVVGTEAATAVVARHCAATGGDEPALRRINRAWLARTPVPAVREASLLAARGYLRLAAPLGLSPLTGSGWCRPLAVGWLAAGMRLTGRQVATVVAYEDVQTVIAAALKLQPFDPARGVAWAAGAVEEVTRLATELARLTDPDQIPARSAPVLDEWCHRHATTERRLFRA